MLAYYLHDLDPFVFRITETFGPRWYGVSYVLGFIAAFFILRKLAQRGYSELKPDQVGDFVVFAALFGIMLGGRLGYMLLYDRERFFSDPASFFKILGGGMASHGGILGLFIFAWVYSRIKKLAFLGLCDDLVTVGPLGVFFGRIANFVNGELYGRITTVPWAVRFPTELREDPGLFDRINAAANFQYAHATQLIAEAKTDPAAEALLREFLLPRHPSQLYQALLEGALLFTSLLLIRLKFKNLPRGILTGLFFIFYAFLRIGAEFFRLIDAGQVPILGMNPGQFYSLFMILIGLGCIAAALASHRRARSQGS